jgi:hypothetical protein
LLKEYAHPSYAVVLTDLSGGWTVAIETNLLCVPKGVYEGKGFVSATLTVTASALQIEGAR